MERSSANIWSICAPSGLAPDSRSLRTAHRFPEEVGRVMIDGVVDAVAWASQSSFDLA